MPSLLSICVFVCLCPSAATRRTQVTEGFIMNSDTDTENICNALPDGPCTPQFLELCADQCKDAKHQVAPDPSQLPSPSADWLAAGPIADRCSNLPAGKCSLPNQAFCKAACDARAVQLEALGPAPNMVPTPRKLKDRAWQPNSNVESSGSGQDARPKPGRLGDIYKPNSKVESSGSGQDARPQPGRLGAIYKPNSNVESSGSGQDALPKPGRLGDIWQPNSNVESSGSGQDARPQPGRLGDIYKPNSKVASSSTSSDASASPGEATQVMCQGILTSLTEAGDGARCKPGFQWRCPTECMQFEPEECKAIEGECTQEWQKNKCTEVCALNKFGAFQSA